MSDFLYVQELFQLLRTGHHLSPEDEPIFGAVAASYEAYASFFAVLGLKLVRHPREFFYFEPEANEGMPDTLPRIAVFSFILIDYLANAGKPIEEYLMTNHFLLSRLPHFSLDRYVGLLRQVEVEDVGGLRLIVKNMERVGWAKFIGNEEFRFLRPFHRVLDKCLDLARKSEDATADSERGK